MTPTIANAIAASRDARGLLVTVHTFTYEDERAAYEAAVEVVTADDETWTAYANAAEGWAFQFVGDGDPR